MTPFYRYFFTFLFITICLSGFSQKKVEILTVPGINQYSKINTSGITILPSGRFATPAGQLIRITDDPFGLAISPDGKKAVTLHDGVFTVIDIQSLEPIRVPSYDNKIESPLYRKDPFWELHFPTIQKRFI